MWQFIFVLSKSPIVIFTITMRDWKNTNNRKSCFPHNIFFAVAFSMLGSDTALMPSSEMIEKMQTHFRI